MKTNIIKSAGRNVAYLGAAQLANILASLIATRLIANYMGVGVFGSYVTAVSFCSLFLPITHMGMNKIVTREIATHISQRELSSMVANAILLRLILTVFAIIIAVITFYIVEIETLTGFFIAALLSLIVLSTDTLFDAVLQGTNNMQFQGQASLIASALRVSLIVLFVHFEVGVVILATTLIIYPLPGLIIKSIAIYRAGLLVLDFHALKLREVKTLFLTSAPLGIGVVLGTAQARIDITILSKLVSASDVGIYGAAYKLLDVFNYAPSLISVVTFPLICHNLARSASNEKLVLERNKKLIYYSLLFCLPLCIAAYVSSSTLVSLVYGPNYAAAEPIFQILILSLFIQFFTPLLANLLISIGRQRVIIYAGMAGLICNVILNLILIPHMGILASAIATVVTNTVVLVLDVVFIKRSLGAFGLTLKRLSDLLIAGSLMAISAILLKQHAHALIATISSGLIYVTYILYKRGEWYLDFKTALSTKSN